MNFREYCSKFIVYLQATLAVAVDQMIECRFFILSRGPPFWNRKLCPSNSFYSQWLDFLLLFNAAISLRCFVQCVFLFVLTLLFLDNDRNIFAMSFAVKGIPKYNKGPLAFWQRGWLKQVSGNEQVFFFCNRDQQWPATTLHGTMTLIPNQPITQSEVSWRHTHLSHTSCPSLSSTSFGNSL